MRPFFLLALLGPLFADAQPNKVPFAVGASDHSIAETFRCDDLMWKIIGMDEGTSIEVSMKDLSFNIIKGGGDLINIGGGCRSDGPPTKQTSTFVTVTYPVNIWPGTVMEIKCPPGRFVYIERWMSKK